jgi:hypothetical protein
MAFGTTWLCNDEWVDLSCRREPRADGLRDKPDMIGDECTADDCRVLRNLGWHEIDGHDQPCAKCERYEWREVPESRLGENDNVCAECKANPKGQGADASRLPCGDSLGATEEGR